MYVQSVSGSKESVTCVNSVCVRTSEFCAYGEAVIVESIVQYCGSTNQHSGTWWPRCINTRILMNRINQVYNFPSSAFEIRFNIILLTPKFPSFPKKSRNNLKDISAHYINYRFMEVHEFITVSRYESSHIYHVLPTSLKIIGNN
jgi:hypothetical protein